MSHDQRGQGLVGPHTVNKTSKGSAAKREWYPNQNIVKKNIDTGPTRVKSRRRWACKCGKVSLNLIHAYHIDLR
jgi:hypothetical protein